MERHRDYDVVILVRKRQLVPETFCERQCERLVEPILMTADDRRNGGVVAVMAGPIARDRPRLAKMWRRLSASHAPFAALTRRAVDRQSACRAQRFLEALDVVEAGRTYASNSFGPEPTPTTCASGRIEEIDEILKQIGRA